MGVIGAAFERLITTQPIPPCQRCGAPMVVVSEERVATVPPVFNVKCRCLRCGALMQGRQVLPHFE